MKAAVFYEPGGPDKIQLGEVPDPKIDHDQVLIKVKACSLNHFDLLVLREADPDNFTFPFWGGADIAGVVAETGDSVCQSNSGDRVVVNPSLYCRQCEHCLSGEESQCNSYGIIGDTVPGGFAEYIAVDETNLMKLPEQISFEEAPWAFLGGFDWHERFHLPVRPGDRLRIKITILSKRPSSKPGRGVVTLKIEMLNQNDQVACTRREHGFVGDTA